MLGEQASHDALVDVGPDDDGELHGDVPAAKTRITGLHFCDSSDELGPRTLGTWLKAAFRRGRQAVLAPDPGPIETHHRRRLDHDRAAQQARC